MTTDLKWMRYIKSSEQKLATKEGSLTSGTLESVQSSFFGTQQYVVPAIFLIKIKNLFMYAVQTHFKFVLLYYHC